MTSFCHCRLLIFVLVWRVLADTTPVHAGVETEELLRLVPDDVTFCVVVQKPRDVANAVWRGPLLAAIRKGPAGTALRGIPEFEQLRQLEKFLSTQLEIDFSQVFENCFGDALVLAYQAGPPGKPEQERGVILSWVRDPKLLQNTLDKLDAAQKQSGELKEVRKIVHHGQTYLHRTKKNGADEYLYVNGSIFAFSAQEPVLHAIIARNTENSKSRLALVSRQLQQSASSEAAAALWINPRSFDGELSLKTKGAQDQDAAFLSTFQSFWRALDSIVVAVHVAKHIELSVALDVKVDQLPKPLRPILHGAKEASSFWTSMPPTPMLAVAGRTDLPRLLDAVSLFLSPAVKKTLQESLTQSLGPAFGRKLLPRIPEIIGPDWGICVSRPVDPKQLCPDVLAAVRVSGKPQDAESVQQLVTGIDAMATLFRFDYNSKHADSLTKKTLRNNGVEVHYLEAERGWPSGFKPAYGLNGNQFLVASRPELITTFRADRTKDSTRGESPLLVVSFREWHAYLKDRQAALIDFAQTEGKRTAPTKPQLEWLGTILTLLDRFEIVQKAGQDGQVRVAARLHFTVPLLP